MSRWHAVPVFIACALAASFPSSAPAQGAGHEAHARQPQGPRPTQAGQDAYAALAEIVRLLDADSSTDWSTVNLERLRQHLIVMHEVTLNARVTQVETRAGVRMDVTGTGRTVRAIRQMLRAHAGELNRMGELRADVAELPNGMRLTVAAADPADTRLVTRIRALGFAGLLTLGDHHGPHHLALAKGVRPEGH